jgi:quinol monooxygenase YgiN
MQSLTIIAPFEVSEGQRDIFHKQWLKAAEPFSRAPGFLSARLYEINSEVENYVRNNIPGMTWLEDRFRFVNIAEWASLSDYEAVVRAHHGPRVITFPSYTAYYHLANIFGEKANPLQSQEPRTEQTFTFIVPFEVPEGKEAVIRQEFREIVTDMSAGMQNVEGSHGPGLYEIDTEAEAHLRDFLSEQLQEERAIFRFVNVAEWASVAHYEAVMRSRHRVKPISFIGHGAYYRVVAEYRGSQQEAK